MLARIKDNSFCISSMPPPTNVRECKKRRNYSHPAKFIKKASLCRLQPLFNNLKSPFSGFGVYICGNIKNDPQACHMSFYLTYFNPGNGYRCSGLTCGILCAGCRTGKQVIAVC